jgi:hypothetical protein
VTTSRTNEKVTLGDFSREVVIVAYNEDVSTLRRALECEGFEVTVQRQSYSETEKSFASSVRCLLNHAAAWKRIHDGARNAIVVEADFVPVNRFSGCTLPMPYAEGTTGAGFAWLYCPGAILYGIDERGFAFGHGNAAVAYALTPQAAGCLAQFSEREMSRNPKGNYSLWDTYFGIVLREEYAFRNYFPTYQYGEHGGIASREHRANGLRRGWHQADILLRALAFQPLYARGSWLFYCAIRVRARVRGWARVLTLRFFDPRHVDGCNCRSRLYMGWFAVARLLRLLPSMQQSVRTDHASPPITK